MALGVTTKTDLRRNDTGVEYHLPAGYRVYVTGGPHDWTALCWYPDDDLLFSRPEDADLAIKALVKAGLTTYEAIGETDRKLVKQICCEAMKW